MRAGGRDGQAVALGERRELAAQPCHFDSRMPDVLADLGAHLDDRLVHLGLAARPEDGLPLFQQFLDVGAQGAGLGSMSWNSSSMPSVNSFASAMASYR